MPIQAVLFDLDSTLLPMDQEQFVKAYFKLLAAKMAPLGYEPKQLIDSIWAGTAAVMKNDGSRLNEEAFWDTFTALCGEGARAHQPVLEEFYDREFHQAREVCGFQPMAREMVEELGRRGKTVVLATNPVFPAVATRSRMSWAGLSPELFHHVTTYENSHFCKPNLDYYREILARIGCAPEECLMVGNDVVEDMAAEALGMRVFLLTDCLINRKGLDISRYPQGGFPELKAFLARL